MPMTSIHFSLNVIVIAEETIDEHFSSKIYNAFITVIPHYIILCIAAATEDITFLFCGNK
jgi:hypothetical protein